MTEGLSTPDVDGWRSWQDREDAFALLDALETWFQATGRLIEPLQQYLKALRATMMEWSMPADRAIGLERPHRDAYPAGMPFEFYEEDLIAMGGDREEWRAMWGWGWFLEHLVWLMAEGLGAEVSAGLQALLEAWGHAE